MKQSAILLLAIFLFFANEIYAQEETSWKYDFGFTFFKSSLNNQPDELLYNPVFARWESINQLIDKYTIYEYERLQPFPFNLSAGIDIFFHYKKYFMIKIGYIYSNTLGIGGKGKITYAERANNTNITESKEIGFLSHQINYFIGPVLPIGETGSEIFMGFSIMSPTYVRYTEKYLKSESGILTRDYEKIFTGFFGNCRSLIGIQVPLSENIKIGSEMIFSYLNGLELKSGNVTDQGFKFPDMQWHFTIRYSMR